MQKRNSVIWQGIKTTWMRSKPYRGTIVFGIIMASLQSVLFPVIQYIFSLIITFLTEPESILLMGTSVPLFAFFLGIWVVLQLLRSIVGKYRRINSTTVFEELKQAHKYFLVKHLLKLPLSFHKNEKRGEITEVIARSVNGVAQINQSLFLGTLPEMLGIAATLALSFTVRPIFLFIFLIAIIIYLISIFRLNKPAADLQRTQQRFYKEAMGYGEDVLSNIRSVKDFSKEDIATSHLYNLYIDKAIPAWKKLQLLRNNNILIQEVIIWITRSLVLGLSVYFVGNGTMTIGEIVAINSLNLRIFDPFTNLSNVWKEVENGSIALEESEDLLKLQPERETDIEVKNKITNGAIRFNNISFGYTDGQTILKNISFDTKPGERVAIVGESGVGKSTLIELLLGYYDPSQGEILVDGHKLSDLNLQHLRRSIALVNQESILFNDTIKNNLLYANDTASDEELRIAAEKSHILEFIESLPQKWDQIVGERGVKLSVGQKQRVSIARALLRNPKILILDEPTSALDAGTERVITDMLEKEMVGKTTFIIAHRLSTVRQADTIVVLKGGQVVEQGTHDQLITVKDGEYRRLYELQIGLHA